MRVTRHSKERIIQRTEGVDNFNEAKRVAKQAKRSGQTINEFQKFPRFFAYLQAKKTQTHSCSIRVYRGNIYIWRGKDSLITAHPIPERFRQEIEEVSKNER